MSRVCWVLVLAAFAQVGCSSPTKPPTTADSVAAAEPPAFSPDQDVPLVAPDEAEAAKTPPRLAGVKRIGGGPDDTSVDGKHRGTTTQASTRAATTSTSVPRGRYYSRGSGAYSSGAGSSTATGSPTPAVGGNFPAAPSFGTPAAR